MKNTIRKLFYLFGLILLIKGAYATKIDTTQIVEIGGIKQFLTINTKNANNPVLLYLHGGPGAAVSAHKDAVTGKLEEHFIVIHWDQRNSGETLGLNPSPVLPTVDIMTKDAEEVMSYVLQHFNREKLVVMANSWGTIPGFHLAKKFPEKISVYIAVSPVISNLKSQQQTLQILQKHFQKEGHTRAVRQLSEVKVPYENVTQMLIQYRWEMEFGGTEMSDEQFEQLLSYFQYWEKMWMPLYHELYNINLEKLAQTIDCPCYFIVGNKDYTTYFKLTEEYFNRLKAPSKKLFWFENTGHNIPAFAAEEMQNIIINDILPSTKNK